MSLMASAVLSALTAVISDVGSDLQPATEISESARTKSNSSLHLIAACLSFQAFADPDVLLSLSEG
jgi:hypothetical protein